MRRRRVAVGTTPVARRPPHRSRRALLHHLAQRHHTRCIRAIGFSGAAGCAGAQAAGEPKGDFDNRPYFGIFAWNFVDRIRADTRNCR
jgi:hypothetical protein